MASMFSRTGSTSNRRSANIAGTRTRMSISRTEDSEAIRPQDSISSAGHESVLRDRSHDKSSKRFSNDLTNIDRRTERRTIVTSEKTIRKSPVKQGVDLSWDTAGERSRKVPESPIAKKRPATTEEPTTPWTPQANLVPYSSAPLATRICTPPLAQAAPKALQPKPFRKMAVKEQESALLDDLLYVFMGYEGQYITYAESYQSSDEKVRLCGPDFQILPGLDPSLRDLTMAMLKIAKHHSALEAFIESHSQEDFGSVNHALCASIRTLLKDYLILVAQLESKTADDPSFTLHQMHLQIIPAAQSLNVLYELGQELLKKNSLLDEDLEDTMDEFDAENILERLQEGGELLPGGMSKKRCIGGNVLSLLARRLDTYSGDPAAKTLLEMLFREASRPYVRMLNEWLHHGEIRDAHSEFLVGERSSIKRERLDEDYTDEYWEKRYYLRDKEVPTLLEAVMEKILLAGKYLNVVRECGGVNINQQITNMPTTFTDPNFLDSINNAYAFSNSSLLSLLLTRNSLRNRLVSLKHYFFLDRAEFFLYFLELSSSELRKPNKSVNVGKLQSLLDLVLRQPGSIISTDPFKEDVKICMNEASLTQWLMKIVSTQGMDPDNQDSLIEKYQPTPAPSSGKEDDKEINGFDAIELDYVVPFPLSLVISRKTISRYQLLFRYTLALRHLETMLVDCWSEHSKTRSWVHKSSSHRIEVWKRRAWTLRARMLVFVQQMLFFATAEVMEPNWQKLMVKVDEASAPDPDSSPLPSDNDQRPRSARSAQQPLTPKRKRTVDELMQDHLDMLDSCMKDLGLTQGKLLKINAKLMMGCTMFATYTTSLSRSLWAADPDLVGTNPAEPRVHSSASRQPSSASTVPPVGAGEADASRMARMDETLKKYEDHFNRHLKILIDSLNYFAATETVVLLSLCARLTAAEAAEGRESRLL